VNRRCLRTKPTNGPWLATWTEQMTLRIFAWIIISISFLVPCARAQQAADVAYIEMVRVKPGNEQAFETTLKRHWGWHEKMGEKWAYFVWSVDTGKNEGAYQITSFGHTWKEVDESNALVAGTPGPEENPDPYHQSMEESYYRYRPDLSTSGPATTPLPVASVTQILLRPEAVHDFEIALGRLANAKRPEALSAQWYELVTGGEQPQFLVIEARPNWSSLRNKGELDAIREAVNGGKVGEDTVKTFWNSIRSIYTETWHYRSDLSRPTVSK